MRHLPPLSTLRPFESAARLGSMSAAARELGVSQPAISRTLGQLEHFLGQPLFVRSRRGLTLTDAGQKLRRAVSVAFDALGDLTEELRAPDRNRTIWLTVNSGFAQQWLAGRLHALHRALPNVYLRLATSDRDSELDIGEYDLAVRFGTGDWRGMRTIKLFTERVAAVCSPEYLARHPYLDNLRSPARLGEEHLLHLDEASARWLTWASWFRAQGCHVRLKRPALLYPNYPLLLGAALTGDGIALGWIELVQELLAKGRLVQLGEPVRRQTHGYYLCRPKSRRMSQAKSGLVDSVAKWLVTSVRTLATVTPGD